MEQGSSAGWQFGLLGKKFCPSLRQTSLQIPSVSIKSHKIKDLRSITYVSKVTHFQCIPRSGGKKYYKIESVLQRHPGTRTPKGDAYHRHRLVEIGDEDFQPNEGGIWELDFVHMRAVLPDRKPFVPLPASLPICPVRPNPMESIMPLLPEPFGPEIANFSLRKSNFSF